jgi:hypothetical protein
MAVFFFGTAGVTTFTTIQLPNQPVPRHNEIDNALAKHMQEVPWLEGMKNICRITRGRFWLALLLRLINLMERGEAGAQGVDLDQMPTGCLHLNL